MELCGLVPRWFPSINIQIGGSEEGRAHCVRPLDSRALENIVYDRTGREWLISILRSRAQPITGEMSPAVVW